MAWGAFANRHAESTVAAAVKLLACIAFHYQEQRLTYLQQVLHLQQYLAPQVHVVVTTTTDDPEALARIATIAPPASARYHCEIEYFSLPNPWLLPWAHKVVIAQKFGDLSFTHFMYVEDDIEVAPANVDYWLRAREALRPFGLYPSFFRVEWQEQRQTWTSTDVADPVSLARAPVLHSIYGDYQYLNMPNPYQAMFFYDRELMLEHMASESFDVIKYGQIENIDRFPGWGGGGVAERASHGLTFVNVPSGFTSRNVIPFLGKFRLIDPRCFVHHLPNNYANQRPELKLGKVAVQELLVP